jgi:hypothetical protein
LFVKKNAATYNLLEESAEDANEFTTNLILLADGKATRGRTFG